MMFAIKAFGLHVPVQMPTNAIHLPVLIKYQEAPLVQLVRTTSKIVLSLVVAFVLLVHVILPQVNAKILQLFALDLKLVKSLCLFHSLDIVTLLQELVLHPLQQFVFLIPATIQCVRMMYVLVSTMLDAIAQLVSMTLVKLLFVIKLRNFAELLKIKFSLLFRMVTYVNLMLLVI
jgi:hypothetical protein